MNEPRGMWPAALPWNTTVTLAEVWAAEFAEAERIRLERKQQVQKRYRARNAAIRQQSAKAVETTIVQRVVHADKLPKLTASGKFAYAGYDGAEA